MFDPAESDDDDDSAHLIEEDEVSSNEIEDTDPASFEDEDPVDDDEEEDSDEDATEPEAAAAEPSHPEIVREVRNIPRSELQLEYMYWANPRTITGLSDEDLRLLADDIRTKTLAVDEQGGEPGMVMAGIEEPLKVVPIVNNGAVINLVIDGQRRLRATDLALGLTAGALAKGAGSDVLIPCMMQEPEPIKWTRDAAHVYLARVLRGVGLRKDLGAYEISESAAALEGTRGESGEILSITEIAAIVGRSRPWTSKILAARKAATPKTLRDWRTGAISEEMFLGFTQVKDEGEQEELGERAKEARSRGDKSSARQVALEAKERVRSQKEQTKKTAAKPAAKPKPGKAVSGPQEDLPIAKPEPAKPRPMSYTAILDLLELAKRKPATHDLVKGILLGIQVAAGILDPGELPKAWQNYLHHLQDKPRPASKAKKTKKRK